MGVLAAAGSVSARRAPGDIPTDDPLWTDSLDAAYWRIVLDLDGPASDADDDAADLPRTRRGMLAELQRLAVERARSAAREVRLLVALAGATQRSREVALVDPEDDEPRSFLIVDEILEEVSVALRRSIGSVRRDLAAARGLAALPATAEALAAGHISPAHAEVVTRLADGLPEHIAPVFERRVLERAVVATSGETAAFARRLRARLDVAGEEARRREAVRHIDVRVWAEDDGLACLQARLPLADAARVHAAIDARARLVAFDPDQTMGERRAAALVEALCGHASSSSGTDAVLSSGAAQHPGAAQHAGVATAVEIQVLVDVATLLGLADDAAFIDLPGDGRVPMTAAALRALVADPAVPVSLRRLVTDPRTGEIVDRGRTAYRVTGDLRAFVIHRDGTCRFPHCMRSALTADLDHVVPWDDGGGTDRRNLGNS